MESTHLENWADILQMIDDLARKESEFKSAHMGASSFLFRGQANSVWELETTLERYNTGPFSVLRYNHVLARVISEVQAMTGTVWNFEGHPSEETDFFMSPPNYDFMVYTRHHGFPSPLLDWTASPYIALFFAFRNAQPNHDVALYAFLERPTGAKSGWVGAPQIVGQGPFTTGDKRHFLQQAQYTVCVEKPQQQWVYSSHQDYFESAGDDQDYLRKYTICSSIKLEVLKKLQQMNVNTFSLFPTEDGLMDSLAMKELLHI